MKIKYRMFFFIIYSTFFTTICTSIELKCAKLTIDAPIVICAHENTQEVYETFSGTCQTEQIDSDKFDLDFLKKKENFEKLVQQNKERECVDKDIFGCPCGWKYFSETKSCYKSYANKRTQFAEAAAECALKNSDLVSITSKKEHEFVKDLLKLQNMWIGLLQVVNNKWMWLDNSKYGEYSNWAIGQPANANESANCVEQMRSTSDTDSKWKVRDCSHHLSAFVCKQRRDDYFLLSLTKNKNIGEKKVKTEPISVFCNDGWRYLHSTQSCYKGFTSTPGTTFNEASSNCAQEISHLTSIHSEKENDFVGGLLPTGLVTGSSDKPWIGLVKKGNVWSWSDGSPLDYLNWWPGQPDNSNKREHCAQIRIWHPDSPTQKWNDMNCEARHEKYICKYTLQK